MTNGLVIFDLDGTLLDTSFDLIDSLNVCLAAHDLAPVTYDDVNVLVGQGAIAMLKRGFELRDYRYDDQIIRDMFHLFLEHYSANMPGKSRLYPGLGQAMDQLIDAGYKLAICTNKNEGLARKLLTELGLIDRFCALTGGDSFEFKKPDGRHILKTIELGAGSPNASIMIGDSKSDIFAAKNAQVPSIAVTFGYSDVPVQELAPSYIIDHYDELTVQLINDLIGPS